jgi:hypothetical protein
MSGAVPPLKRMGEFRVEMIIIITAIEFTLSDNSPYASTNNTNKNKYT